MSILYRDDHEVDLDQLAALFNAVGWERRTADPFYPHLDLGFEPFERVLARRREF